MQRLTGAAIAAVTILALAGAIAMPNSAARAQDALDARSAADWPTDVSAQTTQRRRNPPRIRVYPREDHSLYPRATPYSWPGPGAVRQCQAWLVEEVRPDGVFIVPRQRCWWERS
jgi:hypothetical protein